MSGKIVRVQFIAPKVQACFVCRNARGTAAEVRVEYLLPGLCVVGENPVVQGDRFLGGVDAAHNAGKGFVIRYPILMCH